MLFGASGAASFQRIGRNGKERAETAGCKDNGWCTEQDQPCVRADAVPREDAIISNVVVSNDTTYLWLFENPATAHENYILTTSVANAIAHGSAAL